MSLTLVNNTYIMKAEIKPPNIMNRVNDRKLNISSMENTKNPAPAI